MGIIKTLHFVPKLVYLFQAVSADFLQAGAFINQFAIFENGNLQFLSGKVVDGLGLPGCLGIEDLHVLTVVYIFVVDAQIVRNGLAGIVAEEAVQLLKVGIGDLTHIFRDLDLGNDLTFFVFGMNEEASTALAMIQFFVGSFI